MSVIEINGKRADPYLIATGSATNVIKKGAFWVFSLRVEHDDIREYSFTCRDRAWKMRRQLLAHLERKIRYKQSARI